MVASVGNRNKIIALLVLPAQYHASDFRVTAPRSLGGGSAYRAHSPVAGRAFPSLAFRLFDVAASPPPSSIDWRMHIRDELRCNNAAAYIISWFAVVLLSGILLRTAEEGGCVGYFHACLPARPPACPSAAFPMLGVFRNLKSGGRKEGSEEVG